MLCILPFGLHTFMCVCFMCERVLESTNELRSVCACACTHTSVSNHIRNPESKQLEPFFSAVSYTSRNTCPLLTPTVINAWRQSEKFHVHTRVCSSIVFQVPLFFLEYLFNDSALITHFVEFSLCTNAYALQTHQPSVLRQRERTFTMMHTSQVQECPLQSRSQQLLHHREAPYTRRCTHAPHSHPPPLPL